MSIYVNKAAITDFVPMIQAEFQANGFLFKNTMQERNNVTGDRVRFQKIGKGMAKQKAPQDDVSPLNVDYSTVFAYMEDWNASEYTDIFMQREVNFDEKQALAKVVGSAMGRRLDQIAINALATSGTSNIIVDGGTGFSFLKLLKIVEYMDKKGVPISMGRRFLALSASAQTDLLQEEKITSQMYVNTKLIAEGSLHGAKLLGFNILVVPDMEEGGLPIASNVRKCYAWHEHAAGYATGLDTPATVDWIPEKRSFLVARDAKACATTIDNQGVVEIQIQEAA